ncbi:MAG: HEPN domain-containing protein [Rhodopila sp.]|jgi:HEPN domain-containing protein
MANKRSHPKAYFDAAKGYQSAADRLLLSIESGEGLLIRDPTYFLYAHAVELALKSCLLSSGINPKRTHVISRLYGECRERKLIGTTDYNHDIHNLIYFLGSANECHEYRYPDTPEVPRAIPDLPWAREIVGRLMEEVEPNVVAWVAAHPTSPAPSTKKIAFGKPTFTKQPVPTKTAS